MDDHPIREATAVTSLDWASAADESRAGGYGGGQVNGVDRARRLLIGALTVITLAVLPVLGGMAANTLAGSNGWWVLVAMPVLVAPIVVWEIAKSRRPVTTGPPEAREELLDQLAGVVEKQWRDEAAARRINRKNPIRVTWVTTARPVTVAAGAHDDTAQGDIADATQVLRARNWRMVVLGEPGSGKSVFALWMTLELLEQRRVEQHLPVPVLVSLSSWRPPEPLWHHVSRRLSEDYQGLMAGRNSLDMLLRLVIEKRVLPVMDGLDEIPAELHAAAIESVDAETGGGIPFVLTCRTGDFERAVAASGQALSAAAVLELKPVDLTAAEDYLSQSGPSAAERWRRVLGPLADTQEPLAQVFATPLMIWLARVVYAIPTLDPQELANRRRFPDAKSIEDHLLDAYLPAAYGTPGDPRFGAEAARKWLSILARSSGHGGGPVDVAWWHLTLRPKVPWASAFLVGFVFSFVFATIQHMMLEFFRWGLAYLSLIGGLIALVVIVNNYAKRVYPPLGWRILVGIATSLAFASGSVVADVFQRASDLDELVGAEVVLGWGLLAAGSAVCTCLTSLLAIPIKPRHRPDAISWRERLATAFVVGGGAGALFFFAPEVGATTSVVVFLATCALYDPLARVLSPPTHPRRVMLKMVGRRDQVISLLLACVALGPIVGLLSMLMVWLQTYLLRVHELPSTVDQWLDLGGLMAGSLWFGLLAGLLAGLLVGVARAAFDDFGAVGLATPAASLRLDRLAYAVGIFLAAVGVVGWVTLSVLVLPESELTFSSSERVIPDWMVLVLLALTVVSVRSCWFQFSFARVRWRLSGYLPWNLMAFLHDAHQRGILRQAGAVYQFRHSRLHEYLAQSSSTSVAVRSVHS
ncbi:hypothetical protein Rhe02_78520 [Rhizocola hellebori]|uniref:NACHT domain-containing protein n=1 Tax=Rhizocola hellebori TaxID=1392758 RepID=A0A8J3QHH6_9ACTN|nr:NACHT domain-containing protein [Rhizocola hellebori]GIH09785.1 hypothetical protein Rhe02_78520 [Rhizocola hellebori]